jgi:O-antigen/teichoic acid export membrane protein
MNLRLLTCGVGLLTVALGLAGTHWHGHPDAVAPAKLVVTVAVWFCYVFALAQRLRQRWVAQRFAWLCLALFLAPLLSLGIVNSPRRAVLPANPPAASAP